MTSEVYKFSLTINIELDELTDYTKRFHSQLTLSWMVLLTAGGTPFLAMHMYRPISLLVT